MAAREIKRRRRRVAQIPKLSEEDLQPFKIEGQYYFTIQQFACLTHRTEQTIRYLANVGNRIRRLRHIKIGGKPFIFADEYHAFPFACVGRSGEVCFYDMTGEAVYVSDDDIGLYLAEVIDGAVKDIP